jgi:hypothetical protein
VTKIRWLLEEEKKNTNTKTVALGLGRVVREVRQHPDDHEFESQRWQ